MELLFLLLLILGLSMMTFGNTDIIKLLGGLIFLITVLVAFVNVRRE